MTLQQLTYLVTVADCGSISDAAEKLFISQPSLSAAIRNLEKEMNINAFSRSKKGVVPTREGEELISLARGLLEHSDLIKNHFGVGIRRSPAFSVSSLHYTFAINAFARLVEQYDSDRYSMRFSETQTWKIIEEVSNGKSEIGILFLSDHNNNVLNNVFAKENLEFEELFVSEPHAIISTNNPLASKKKIKPEELMPYPYLVFEQLDKNSFSYSEQFLSMVNYPKNIFISDRAGMYELIVDINAFTVGDSMIHEEIAGKTIVTRPLDIDIKLRIGFIRKKHSPYNEYVESYISHMKKLIEGNNTEIPSHP